MSLFCCHCFIQMVIGGFYCEGQILIFFVNSLQPMSYYMQYLVIAKRPRTLHVPRVHFRWKVIPNEELIKFVCIHLHNRQCHYGNYHFFAHLSSVFKTSHLKKWRKEHIDGLVQHCTISSALAMGILHLFYYFYTSPSKWCIRELLNRQLYAASVSTPTSRNPFASLFLMKLLY